MFFRNKREERNTQGRPLSYSRGALEAVEAGARMVWRHRVLTALLLVVCVFAVEFTLLKMPQAQAAYTIANSARFISGNSDYLSKTLGSPTDATKWTFSVWLKRPPDASADHVLFAAGASTDDAIKFDNGDTLQWFLNNAASGRLITSGLFRDPAKWYHLVFVFDSSNATANSRMRIYQDGVEITAFGTRVNPSSGYSNKFNANSTAHAIGRYGSTASQYFDGYMSDTYFVDGQALDPTCFGATDANGYWRPITYSTASPCAAYGTNGFKLDFANSADFGNDVSGNNNDWTNNNLATTDQVTDSPTNSFATLNSINVRSTTLLTKGNLKLGAPGSGVQYAAVSTIGAQTGKWYWEFTPTVGANEIWPGAVAGHFTRTELDAGLMSGLEHPDICGYQDTNGNKRDNTPTSSYSYGNSYTTGDVIGVALDMNSGKVWFSKNGTWQASGDPAAGTNAACSGITTALPWFAYGSTNGATTPTIEYNFGQGGQASLTYDSASGGTFKYTPPSGFKALSTANLPEPAIVVPKNYFDAITYQGSGVARTVATSLFIATTTGTTTWMVPPGVTEVSYLVVAGGGGGGYDGGGGGGGGAFRSGSNYTVVPGTILTVTVGAGGTGGVSGSVLGGNGGASVFDTITASYGAGGGGSGNSTGVSAVAGATGGSGGGARGNTGASGGTGGSAGNAGGATVGCGAGGGGGAGTAGTNGSSSAPQGTGGNGLTSSIAGASTYYAGGGGGANPGCGDASVGAGGLGGGGSAVAASPGNAGTNGLGGGGGGGGGVGTRAGGAGGSGIVVISYTPNASTIGFTPDLVWIKDRTSALMHNIFDSARLVYPYWSSNASTAETGGFGQTLTAFLSNGFSLGTNALFNTSGNNYISWLWKESPTSGVDVVTYTGTGAAQTIAHSLGVVPDFIIVKDRGAANDGAVYHSSNTAAPATDYLLIDSTAATADDDTYWNDTAPTASVFSVKSNADVNTSGNQYVAYLFASTTGFSSFGTYTGNASTDGPLVYTGFKPKVVLLKHSSAAGDNWRIIDGARNTYNPADDVLQPSTANAETGSGDCAYDFLAIGFKVRSGTNTGCNDSGTTVVYAAFADVPFKYSSAVSDVGALSIANSARFISGNSDYLSKTPGSASNRKTWTFSTWVKRAELGAYQNIFQIGTAGSDSTTFVFRFDSSDRLDIGGGATTWRVTSAVYRDPAAWLHLVLVMDTTQATAADRIKLYVNGSQVTAFGTNANPTQNADLAVNNNALHAIGRHNDPTQYLNGYLSDAHLIDGAALAPTCFGEYDSNGYWRPKPYSTGSPCAAYGTNGFHLDFTNGSSLGTDTSGNGNTWTVNGLTSVDQVIDTPTNNFNTFSPIDKNSTQTQSSGNLITGYSGAGGWQGSTRSTFWISSGKWYWELTATNPTSYGAGVTQAADPLTSNPGNSLYGYAYHADGTMLYNNNTNAGSNSTWTSGTHVVGFALDLDSSPKTLKVYLDNALQSNFFSLSGTLFTPFAGGTNNTFGTFNFGQGGLASLTYDSAAGGYFKYTPPSGFKALSTSNLPEPAVAVPKNYFDAVTYTGSGTATSTWAGFVAFQPDLVWIKDRTSANAHGIFSTSTTLYPAWASNATTPEGGAGGTALSAFLSNGFSLGASSTVNTLGDNFIAWMWKKCPAIIAILCPASNGVDIVKYTGTGANRTISHSLGTVPDMMILKRRDSTGNSTVYHGSLTASTTQILLLNTTAAVATDATAWNSTAPTASVYSLGTNVDVNASAGTYVAYLFKGVDGFSKFGSYTGNAAADGPFIYTGFKPKYIMIKSSTATDAWLIYDTARNTFNVAGTTLVPNTAAADATISGIDFLSNGFKLRTITTTPNAAQTYIYAAFAEQPFKYSAASAASVASTFVQAVAFLMGMVF